MGQVFLTVHLLNFAPWTVVNIRHGVEVLPSQRRMLTRRGVMLVAEFKCLPKQKRLGNNEYFFF